MSEVKSRHRLSIPQSDTTTLEWLKAQSSMSASIRFLIREYVSKCGYTDPTCLRVEQEVKRPRLEKPEAQPKPETPERIDNDGFIDPEILLGLR